MLRRRLFSQRNRLGGLGNWPLWSSPPTQNGRRYLLNNWNPGLGAAMNTAVSVQRPNNKNYLNLEWVLEIFEELNANVMIDTMKQKKSKMQSVSSNNMT